MAVAGVAVGRCRCRGRPPSRPARGNWFSSRMRDIIRSNFSNRMKPVGSSSSISVIMSRSSICSGLGSGLGVGLGVEGEGVGEDEGEGYGYAEG